MATRDNGGPDKAVVGFIVVLLLLLVGSVYIVSSKKGKTPAPETKPATSRTVESPEVPITSAEEEPEDEPEEVGATEEENFGTDKSYFRSIVRRISKKTNNTVADNKPATKPDSNKNENTNTGNNEGGNNQSGNNEGGNDEGGEEEQQPDYLLEQNLDDENVLYMQDVTQEMVNDMEYGETITLVDRRTGVEYEAVRLTDGYGWNNALYMESDLKLGSTEKPMLLTPEHTNIYSNYVLPKSSEPKEDYSIGDPAESSVSIDGDDYLYSPQAAAAGSLVSNLGNNAIIFNASQSICPKGWRLPTSSEDYDSSDGMTETSFSSEMGRYLYYVADKNNNYNLPPIPFATTTIRDSYDWDDETGEEIPLGVAMQSYSLSGYYEYPINSSSIMHVRCVFAPTISRRLNLTIDFNGGTFVADSGWGDPVVLDKMEYYKTWGGSEDEYFLPNVDYGVERPGYKFLGLSTNKNATEAEFYDNGDWSSSDHKMKISDYLVGEMKTVYVIWEKKILIRFDANGGKFWTNKTVNYGTLDPVDKYWISGGYNDPYYDGMRLLGWATSSNSSVVEYVPYPDEDEHGFDEIEEDTVLYAVWRPEGN